MLTMTLMGLYASFVAESPGVTVVAFQDPNPNQPLPPRSPSLLGVLAFPPTFGSAWQTTPRPTRITAPMLPRSYASSSSAIMVSYQPITALGSPTLPFHVTRGHVLSHGVDWDSLPSDELRSLFTPIPLPEPPTTTAKTAGTASPTKPLPSPPIPIPPSTPVSSPCKSQWHLLMGKGRGR